MPLLFISLTTVLAKWPKFGPDLIKTIKTPNYDHFLILYFICLYDANRRYVVLLSHNDHFQEFTQWRHTEEKGSVQLTSLYQLVYSSFCGLAEAAVAL